MSLLPRQNATSPADSGGQPDGIAAGTVRLGDAIQRLRTNWETASAEPKGTEAELGPDGKPKKQVDLVRKMDLMQRLADLASGAEAAVSDEVSLQDRVFHSMVLERLPDFSTLGPSFERSKHQQSQQQQQQQTKPGDEAGDAGDGGKSSQAGQKPQQQQQQREPKRPAIDKSTYLGRGRGIAKAERRSKTGLPAEVKEIIIPIGPERLTNPELRKLHKTEFAVRYCESINVAPTAPNVMDVLRRMPFEQCTVRQVVHPGLGRAERKNYVSIIPPCYKPTLEREKAKRRDEALVAQNIELDVDPRAVQPFEALRSSTKRDGKSGAVSSALLNASNAVGAAGSVGGGGSSSTSNAPCFEDYKHRFVHPYNLSSRFEADPDAVRFARSGAGGNNTGNAGSTLNASAKNANDRQSFTRTASRSVTFGGLTAGDGLASQTFGDATSSGEAVVGGAAGLRAAAREARGEIDRVQESRRERMALYDTALAKLKRGERLGSDDVESLRQAVTEERPLSVTAAHIHALDELLNADATEGAASTSTAIGATQAVSAGRAAVRSAGTATLARGVPANRRGGQSAANAAAEEERERARFLDAAAQRELDSWTSPSGPGEMRTLQSLFVRDFPFTDYFDSHDEIVSIKAALCADDVGDLACAMARFVFVAYVVPRASSGTGGAPTVTPADVDDAFVSFYEKALRLLYASLGGVSGSSKGRAEQQPSQHPDACSPPPASTTPGMTPGQRSISVASRGDGGGALTRAGSFGAPPSRLAPMIVLLLRVALEHELRGHVPTFLRTAQGRDLAVTADNVVMAVLDPLNLLSHVSVVESTPHAMRVLQTKRRPGRIPPLLTSPLTHFVLGEPQSANAKAMARSCVPRLQRGLRELEKHLTPLARSRLLQTMATVKFGVDPQLDTAA